MIVDTSALIAIVNDEHGSAELGQALIDETAMLPAPALVEYERVSKKRGSTFHAAAMRFIDVLRAEGLSVAPFDDEAAKLAVAANEAFGSGNGRGGKLNMLDLMVYGVAKAAGRPILCTGNDFASTDAAIHPASRLDG